MKLYCVRHGEAEEADINPLRPLTEQGRDDVEAVARFMGETGLHVDYLLHSTKQRAVETALIFAKYLSIDEVNESHLLLEDSAISPLLDMIAAWSHDTMLVGHLPFMSQLVSALVTGSADYYPIVNYPPGTVVCLDRYQDHRWMISWLLSPHLVPGR